MREVHMNAAADAYLVHLDGCVEVRPFVLVHPPRGEGVRHEFHNGESNRMRIGSPETVLDEIVGWLVDQPQHRVVVDRRLMYALSRCGKR